ncbi:uncharacterized protein LOC131153049 [Malania oleifera]|uniref:uncharacterized protein LOC131153049 n=1 Tax=Malania oleifera TaxID=397392 RepID=UPI0025AE21B8|nr:uncharacterized protein LOC131153049 [Malania oleifera]
MAEEGGGGEAEKRVMVAIDESENSYNALMWVLDNLKESITKSPLVIFAAQPPPQYNYTFAASLGSARMYCPVSATADFVNSVREQEKKVVLGLLEKAKSICTSRGVKAEIVTDIGDPSTAICNAVEKLEISLLILGNQGTGKLKSTLLGSVSSYCVQNAKCPVLVVKKPL